MDPASDVSIPLFDTKLKVKSTNDGAEKLQEHPRGERMLSEVSLISACWYAMAYPQSASRSKIETIQLFFS